MATPANTGTYREQFTDKFEEGYFRYIDDCFVSSIGAGTYLGEPTDEVDDSYREALITALENGINVIDTAINYRCQRSERVIGQAIADATVDREAVFVATKGGYLPFDEHPPADPEAYVRSKFIESGVMDPEDLTEGLHCITPEYIDQQLNWSLTNLGLNQIDLYYIHNPEAQLSIRSREAVYNQLEAAFTRLEERASAGDIRRYGVATWDAFRVDESAESYLSLSEIVSRARAAADATGNTESHLRAIQLPFNPLMADAFTVWSHETANGERNALGFARDTGLSVFTSGSLAKGRLTEGLPEGIDVWIPGDTPSQRAINFARSAPAVTSALVSMRSTEDIEENVAAGTFEPMGSEAFEVVFE